MAIVAVALIWVAAVGGEGRSPIEVFGGLGKGRSEPPRTAPKIDHAPWKLRVSRAGRPERLSKQAKARLEAQRPVGGDGRGRRPELGHRELDLDAFLTRRAAGDAGDLASEESLAQLEEPPVPLAHRQIGQAVQCGVGPGGSEQQKSAVGTRLPRPALPHGEHDLGGGHMHQRLPHG